MEDITVTYSKELLQSYFKWVFDKTGKRTKLTYTVTIICAIVFAGLAALLYGMQPTVTAEGHGINLFHIAVGLCLISIAVAIIYTVILIVYPKMSAKKMSNITGKTVVYGFTETYCTATLPTGEGKRVYNYRTMCGVAITKEYIYLYRTSAAAFIIPYKKELADFLCEKLEKLN